MRVYEAVAAQLVHEGVDTLFGLMGDGNLKLIPHLTSELGVRFVGARHESGGLAMADGYARATGRVGVCTVTQGPGLSNTLTSLISARKARTPLVVLAGDTPASLQGHPQATDQDAIYAAAGVPVQPFRAETAAADVAAAFARARAEQRPVGMNLPTDVQDVELAAFDGPVSVTLDPVTTPPPDPDALAQLVALLAAAERPVLVGGRGALRSDAGAALRALAAHCGALLATSLPVKSWFDDEPFNLGIAGGFAHDLAVELIRGADVVVAFGASVNHFTSKGGTLFTGATTLVHVDREPAAIGSYTPAAHGVVGDAAEVARAALAALEAAGPARTGYRTEAIRTRLAAHRRRDEFTDASGPDGVDPRTLCEHLEDVLPAHRVLVTDGGHFCGFPAMHLGVPEPGAFAFTLDFGSVGLGLATGIGAAIGRPDHLPVVAIGDGGLLMNLGELDTAVRARVPLLVLVFDDGAYGAEMHFLRMLGLPDGDSLFATPDLAATARALGAEAVTVTDLDELRALDGLVTAPREVPLVVHAKVNQHVRAGWLEEAFARSVH